MYFPTFNSYFNETNIAHIEKKEETICIICWESDGIIEDLRIIVNNLHVCHYNAKIHNECLSKWFSKNNYCPMCRNKINMLERTNKNDSTKMNIFLKKSINMLLFCLKYCNLVTYTIVCYFIIYCTCNVITYLFEV